MLPSQIFIVSSWTVVQDILQFPPFFQLLSSAPWTQPPSRSASQQVRNLVAILLKFRTWNSTEGESIYNINEDKSKSIFSEHRLWTSFCQSLHIRSERHKRVHQEPGICISVRRQRQEKVVEHPVEKRSNKSQTWKYLESGEERQVHLVRVLRHQIWNWDKSGGTGKSQ